MEDMKLPEDKELLFGITEFFNVSDCPGFDGLLKTRISDFLVNEVDISGNILHLTELGVSPELFKDDPVADDSFDPEVKNQIKNFLSSTDKSIKIPAPDDKDARRVLHQQIEAHFPNQRLIRDPQVEGDGSRVIVISRGAQQSQQFRRQEATRNRRSANDYIHFNLYKENMDTAEAVSIIGGSLRINSKLIQFAGVKDKRARTVQKISIKYRDPLRLAKFFHPAVRIGNFSFEKDALRLGDLAGNHFQLAIRGITAPRVEVEDAVKLFSQGGFINYYGLQRFGTTEVSTMDVGIALLKSEWANAIDLILRPRSGDNDTLANCRRIWKETKEADKALRVLGRRHCIESDLLQGLVKNNEKDPLSAIQNIPRNSRLIYVHSYQSYLFNLAASYRIKSLGRKPIVGDLALKLDSEPSSKRQKTSIEAAEDIVLVTADTLDQFSIYDIVLPLPGFDVKFPDNAVTMFLLDHMSADGIDLRQRHKIKDYSLSGSYRHIASKPKNISFEIKQYDDPIQDLLLSDLGVIEKRKLPPTSDTGIHTALLINFTLSSSVYATMAIRELTRRSSDHRFSSAESLKIKAELGADQCDTEVLAINGDSEVL